MSSKPSNCTAVKKKTTSVPYSHSDHRNYYAMWVSLPHMCIACTHVVESDVRSMYLGCPSNEQKERVAFLIT